MNTMKNVGKKPISVGGIFLKPGDCAEYTPGAELPKGAVLELLEVSSEGVTVRGLKYEPRKCSCPIDQVMAHGCTCGGA